MAKYEMTISRLTVDKLGVNMYDRVSAVLAELIANSYDADATKVTVAAPLGEYLATQQSGVVKDKGFTIVVEDDGIGMKPSVINDYYLKVGGERRNDPHRGNTSKEYSRKVMGRKGVGKLAPFGICRFIEVISAGGDKVQKWNACGVIEEGYLTAHLILDREEIMKDKEGNYEPEVGDLDETISRESGTRIILSDFSKRMVPDIGSLQRQISQRFGISRADWKIIIRDSTKTASAPNYETEVGSFSISIMEGTKFTFQSFQRSDSGLEFNVIEPDGQESADLKAGFNDDESNFYPVTGWVAYSKEPYKDELMAGIRVYCRGKIATQTSVFNRKAGFTGEHSIRSYIVGELNADWLDEGTDLILTDRRDIHWSHDLGQAFQNWGQSVIEKLGRIALNPMRKKTWEHFKEKSDVERRVTEVYPTDKVKEIRENAIDFAKTISRSLRPEEIDDPEHVDSLVGFSIMLAPHITLDRILREAIDESNSSIAAIISILKIARIAELSSFGKIAEERVKVIQRLEKLKEDDSASESDFQKLIEEAPWLIDPQWSPVTFNQTLANLRKAFERYYKEKTGNEINLSEFSLPLKRPDFVMLKVGDGIEIIEIKVPGHGLSDDDLLRLRNYWDVMEEFFKDPANCEFRKYVSRYHFTLVCDKTELSRNTQDSYSLMLKSEILKQINWESFLLKTKQAHGAFLELASTQRISVSK